MTAAASRALELVRFDPDPPHRQPRAAAVVVAAVVALAGSLLADWLLAKAGVAAFPSTRGYQHFQFGDYAKLTAVGVLGAALAWPIVARLCSAPRWLYLRLAVLVTIVLLLPDLAIAVVTYVAMTRLAPVGTSERVGAHA